MFRGFVGHAEDRAVPGVLDGKSDGICDISVGVGDLSV
jgi:hypothetical protein